MDTVVGKRKGSKRALLVLTERKTRKELIVKLSSATSTAVVTAIDSIERRFGESIFKKIFRSITVDNGSEFADYQGIEKSKRSKKQRTKVYYCHPYSSFERGSNENQNRLIRRFIPKGTDIGLICRTKIQRIEDWINSYPRALFSGKCSDDLFTQELMLAGVG